MANPKKAKKRTRKSQTKRKGRRSARAGGTTFTTRGTTRAPQGQREEPFPLEHAAAPAPAPALPAAPPQAAPRATAGDVAATEGASRAGSGRRATSASSASGTRTRRPRRSALDTGHELTARKAVISAPEPSSSPARITRSARPTEPAPTTAAENLTQAQIYELLAALLVPYARRMESEMHPKIGFCLKAKSPRTGREAHFGGVQALEDCVAYHLFPLYGHPDLLEGVSPELFNRLRSKTCFHFEEIHAGLVAELAELTRKGFERFLADGML